MISRIIVILFSISLIACQSKTEKWKGWIQENSHGIALSDTSNFEDLSFLKEILKDKRIVFLGESGHGVAEYTILKSRLIRFLHEEMDFNVLAFESNAADAFAADYFNSYTNVNSSIYNSISTLWHVEEIIPLFQFIDASHLTNDPLIVQGIDITQSNGGYAFSRFLFQLIFPLDSIYAKEIMNKDSTFSAQGVRKWTIGHILNESQHEVFRNLKEESLADYTLLKTYIQENRDIIQETRDHDIEVALFYLQSRIDFIHWSNSDSTYIANLLKVDPERKKSIEWLFKQFREHLQSQNLRFLAEKMFPDEKIIVWAQNAHIKKYTNRMSYELNKVMPTYSIALYCYSGKGDWTFGQGFDGTHPDSMTYEFITPQDPLSIGQILHASSHDITFVDMRNQIENVGNSWMFNISKTQDWDGSGLEEHDNIRDVWDALILVNKVSTPEYLKYEYDYLNRNEKGHNKR